MNGFFPASGLATKPPPSLVPRCGACGLLKVCRSPKMPVDGEGRRKILVVGEAPGQEEDARGRPFVGPTGALLRDSLAKVGVDLRRDCWLTNAVICRPPRNKMPDKAVDYCRPNLVRAVQELRPEVILLLGAHAVRSLIGWLWKEDTGGIGRWVGWRIPCQRLNAWVCPTWHPAALLHGQEEREHAVREKLFGEHLAAACALSGRPWDSVPDYRKQVQLVHDPAGVPIWLDTLRKRNKPLAFDLETSMLKPDHPDARIVCCAVSDGGVSVAFPWHGEAIRSTEELLRSPVPKIGFNCFSGDTKLLTREYGVMRFSKLVGRTVSVLNHEGRWARGEVRSFGEQETVQVTFSRRNHQKTVRATWGHEWISEEGGTRIPTKGLRRRRYGAGGRVLGPDRVPYQPAPKAMADQEEYVRGVQHGVVLGDGTCRKDRRGFFQLRLCGEKSELLRFFAGYSWSYPPSSKGDPTVYVTRQSINLKEPPPPSSSDSYLIGFFRGLLATDGCVNHRGQISITNSRRTIRWCRKFLPKVGYLFQGSHSCLKYAGRYEGGYESVEDTWTIYLSRESVSGEDLLRSSHRKKWKNVRLGPFKFSGFGDRRVEEVFCVTVPDGNSFTLDGGLVTGNCKFEDRWCRRVLGVRVRNWAWDGMLAAHVLDNRPGVCGLKFQSFVLLGQESYDDAIKPFLQGPGSNEPNRIKEVDLGQLLTYCALDALLEWRVAEKQAEQLGMRL